MRFPGVHEGVLAQEKDTYIPCHAPGDGTWDPAVRHRIHAQEETVPGQGVGIDTE